MVGSFFDLFQMPVKREEAGKGMIQSSLIDQASLNLYERFQMLILLLSQFTISSEMEDSENTNDGEYSTSVKKSSDALNEDQQLHEKKVNSLSTSTGDCNVTHNNRESVIDIQMKRNRRSSSIFTSQLPSSQGTETVLTHASFLRRPVKESNDSPERNFNIQNHDNYRSPFTNPKIANIHEKFEKINKGYGGNTSNRTDQERSTPKNDSASYQYPSHLSSKYYDNRADVSPIRSFSHSTPPSNRENRRPQSLYSTGGGFRGNDMNARVMSYNLNHSPSSYKSREDFNKRNSVARPQESMWTRDQVKEMAKRERYLRTRSVYEPRETLKFGVPAPPQPTFVDRGSPVFDRVPNTPKNEKIMQKRYSMMSPAGNDREQSHRGNGISTHSRTPSFSFTDSFVQELKGQNSDDERHYNTNDEDDEFEDVDYDNGANDSFLSGLSTGSSKRFSTRF